MELILRDLYADFTKNYSETHTMQYAQMTLMNLIFVYNKALVQQKNYFPIVLQALKVKICPIVSKAGRKAESAQKCVAGQYVQLLTLGN